MRAVEKRGRVHAGTVRLEFGGIRSTNGLEQCAGDVWLYEELHAVEDAIELSVLLETEELRIIADGLSITCNP